MFTNILLFDTILLVHKQICNNEKELCSFLNSVIFHFFFAQNINISAYHLFFQITININFITKEDQIGYVFPVNISYMTIECKRKRTRLDST